MIPVISVPNLQMAPPVQPNVVTAATSNVAVGSLPLTFVAPAVAQSEINNYSRGIGAPATGKSNASVSVLTYTPSTPAPVPQTTTSQLGFTSQFMAQALGQGSGDSASLAALFSSTTPEVVNTGTYLTFNMVKFKPSNAAIPYIEPPQRELASGAAIRVERTPVSAPAPAPMPAPAVQQEIASAPQSAQMATHVVKSVAPQVVSIPAPAPAPSRVRAEANVSANKSGSVKSVLSSLVKASGMHAYVATIARNSVNLNSSFEPKHSVTL